MLSKLEILNINGFLDLTTADKRKNIYVGLSLNLRSVYRDYLPWFKNNGKI